MKTEVTKLRKLSTNSVDLVRRGANQNAHITLYKSAEEPEDITPPDDVPQGLWDAIKKGIRDWWNGDVGEPEEEIQKTAEEIEQETAYYGEILQKSLDSIVADDTLDTIEKIGIIDESIDQYLVACEKLQGTNIEKTAQEAPESILSDDNVNQNKDIEDIEKSQETAEYPEEGEEMKIDKSRFSPEELTQYEALIAKGKVDDEEPEVEEIPEDGEEKEEEEMHPEVKKALEEVAELKKSYEMKELTDIAKKYAIIGKNEEELAGKLYEMKKSSPSAYNDYVALLDEQVGMVEKMGTFSEIGKSARGFAGGAGGDAQSKIEAIASEIQKADPTLDRPEAIMKAWDQHPELVAEYERTYKA